MSETRFEHDIDPIYVPICSVCGKDIEYDDDTQQWRHPGVLAGEQEQARG